MFVYDMRTRTYRHPAVEGAFPKWLSDSRQIVYVTGGNRLALVDIAGGKPKILLFSVARYHLVIQRRPG